MSGVMLGFAAGRDSLTGNDVAEIPSVFPHVDVGAFFWVRSARFLKVLFLTAFIAQSGAFAEADAPVDVDPTQRGRPRKAIRPKPIAPFERNATKAVGIAFDRITGASVNANELKTYAEALAQFHMSTEDKFENGDFKDMGVTKRRRVFVQTVSLIGKEANKVGVHGAADPVAEAQATFDTADRCSSCKKMIS